MNGLHMRPHLAFVCDPALPAQARTNEGATRRGNDCLEAVGQAKTANPPSKSSAEDNWEALTTELMMRWMSNGGKGRKITVNANGMVCTTYEIYLRRFPGTLC